MLAGLVAALVVVPESRGLVPVAALTRLVGGVLLLLGALVLYLWWRDSGRSEPAWLVAATTYIAAQSIVTLALSVSHHPNVVARPGWLAITQLVAGLVLLGMVSAAHRVPLRTDPLLLGLTTAILVVTLQLALLWGPGPLGLPGWTLGLVVAAVAAIFLLAGLVAVRLPWLPRWARVSVGTVTTLLAIGHLGGAPIGLTDQLALAAGCAHLLAGLLVVMVASAMLHEELSSTRRDVGSLSQRLRQVELDGREDRARLHEIRATLAGITTASQLLHDRDAELDEETRVRLQRTVRSEMARMQRLMEDRHVSDPTAVDLDETLDPLLETHRARGHEVQWHPSGHRVHARQDDVAEAVNILLENAAKHAGGRASQLGVAPDGDDLLISVTDSGPGIPARLHHQIFDWGVRGDASSGQGIGLYVARRLVSEQGGSLTVTTPPGSGTTFTIRLPAARTHEETHDPDDRSTP